MLECRIGPGEALTHLTRLAGPHTGFSSQFHRLRGAFTNRDTEGLQEECVRLVNCETPELFRDTVGGSVREVAWGRVLPVWLVRCETSELLRDMVGGCHREKKGSEGGARVACQTGGA